MISWAVGYYIKAIGAITSILQMKRLGLGKFIYLFKGIYAVSGRDNLESWHSGFTDTVFDSQNTTKLLRIC